MSAEPGSVTAGDVDKARRSLGGDVVRTPLLRPPELAEKTGAGLQLKAELLQQTGSFKARGALNWLRHAGEDTLRSGLITVSAGNHAKALAWAAAAVEVPLTVVMPAAASPLKARSCRDFGAEVILHGKIDETWAHAARLQRERALTLVPPYDHPRIIAGQGTIGLEILAQCPAVDTILCPVGGGGLLSGLAVAVKGQRPDTRVIGVEPARAETLGSAWRQGRPVTLASTDTVAASLGANRAGEYTHALSLRWVDELVTVDEDAILAGFRAVVNQGRLVAEPGACVAVAAVLAGRVDLGTSRAPVALVTGGNLDPDKLRRLL
jgi:threonine dehydratase